LRVERWRLRSKRALRSDRPRPIALVGVHAPFYIVCEGATDAAFIETLLTNRGMPTQAFQIGEAEGHTGFQRHLEALMTSSDRPRLTHLAVVGDNDDVPAERFLNIQTALAGVGLPVPGAPSTIVAGPPVVGVFMMPSVGLQGTLESLLMDSVTETQPEVGACVETFRECISAPGNWGVSKVAKMRLNATIAACCVGDPSASVAYVWGKNGNPIQIGSAVFNPLATFLQQVSAT